MSSAEDSIDDPERRSSFSFFREEGAVNIEDKSLSGPNSPHFGSTGGEDRKDSILTVSGQDTDFKLLDLRSHSEADAIYKLLDEVRHSGDSGEQLPSEGKYTMTENQAFNSAGQNSMNENDSSNDRQNKFSDKNNSNTFSSANDCNVMNIYESFGNPPISAKCLYFRAFASRNNVSGAITQEESAGIFVGQLPSSYSEADIIALLICIGNETNTPVHVRDVKCHSRDRTCAFVMVNSNSISSLLIYSKRILCDLNCAWVVDRQHANLLPNYIRQFPRESLKGVPKASLVIEKLTPQARSRQASYSTNELNVSSNPWGAPTGQPFIGNPINSVGNPNNNRAPLNMAPMGNPMNRPLAMNMQLNMQSALGRGGVDGNPFVGRQHTEANLAIGNYRNSNASDGISSQQRQPSQVYNQSSQRPSFNSFLTSNSSNHMGEFSSHTTPQGPFLGNPNPMVPVNFAGALPPYLNSQFTEGSSRGGQPTEAPQNNFGVRLAVNQPVSGNYPIQNSSIQAMNTSPNVSNSNLNAAGPSGAPFTTLPTAVSLPQTLFSARCYCGQNLSLSQSGDSSKSCSGCNTPIDPFSIAYWCVHGHVAICTNCVLGKNVMASSMLGPNAAIQRTGEVIMQTQRPPFFPPNQQ